jgi:ABC-type transporter MlaC component
MSIPEARAEAEKRRLARVTPTTTAPTDFRDDYTKETKDVIDTIKAQNDADKKAQLDAAEQNKKLAEEYNNSMISEHQNALTQFENDQNQLVSQYEGNRLNQVQ